MKKLIDLDSTEFLNQLTNSDMEKLSVMIYELEKHYNFLGEMKAYLIECVRGDSIDKDQILNTIRSYYPILARTEGRITKCKELFRELYMNPKNNLSDLV
jgi:hypothetical protein